MKVFKSKYCYQAWWGSFYDSYFERLDEGEWKNVSRFKYFRLKMGGFRVRKILRSENDCT